MSTTKTFSDPTQERLRKKIETLSQLTEVYLKDAETKSGDEQSKLLEIVDEIQTDQETFIALLKKLQARETATNEKSAADRSHRPIRMVPQRYRQFS